MKRLTYLMLFLNGLPLFSQTINIQTASELQVALNNALPGQILIVDNGVFIQSGGFHIPANVNGTEANPIHLKGSGNTTLSSNNLSSGYGLYLEGNSYWIIEDLLIHNSKKGIVLDNSHYDELRNLIVSNIGEEAIHLRTFSSFNLVSSCHIDSTGQVSASIGEGIYIGSAISNWGTYTNGNPDTCNYNQILDCSFGDLVVSENIDIKEGTTGGILRDNSFNGTGLNNLNYADSWVDVKGNSYLIECNSGINSLTDGFQTHINAEGYGNYNRFFNNIIETNSSGYGINVKLSSSVDTANCNVVCSNNIITNTSAGLTNIPTILCEGSCDQSMTIVNSNLSEIKLYPSPTTNGYVNLEGLELNSEIIILNNLGQILIRLISTNEKCIIDCTELQSGIYFLKVKGVRNQRNLTFLKDH